MLRAVALAVVVLAVLAVQAGACSCVSDDPRDALARADAALVGTVVDGTRFGDWNARIRVEKAYKGDLGGEVAVLAGDDSSSCSLELEAGKRVGLLLSRNDKGGWGAGSCSTISPEDLELATQPIPVPSGSGRAAFLLAGEYAGVAYTLLDERGGILAYARGAGFYPADVCPGSQRVVETVFDRPNAARKTVRIRRLHDMRVVATAGRVAREADVSCRDPLGRSLLVLESDGHEPRARSRLLRVSDGRVRTIHRGTAHTASFTRGRVFLDEGRYGRDLVEVDPVTGSERAVARTFPLMTGWELSPDGRRLASVSYDLGVVRSTPPTSVVVVRLGDRPRVTRAEVGASENVGGSATWLSSTRLLFGAEGARFAVYDERPKLVRQFRTHSGAATLVRLGGRLFGVAAGVLQAVDPRTMQLTDVARLPTRKSSELIALPERPVIAVPAEPILTLARRVGRLCPGF